jgi:hypothetical protein
MRTARLVILLSAAGMVRAETVTFYEQIAPIVYQTCSPCHRPGGAGPFPLISFEDVKKHIRQIVAVTKRGYMPPWLPEPVHGEFRDEPALTVEQIRLFERWLNLGTPVGPRAATSPPPALVAAQHFGSPDLVVQAPNSFHLRAGGPDEYWNFILPLHLEKSRWIKALEIRIGNERAVRQATIFIDRTQSARMAERISGAGFPGINHRYYSDTFEPESQFFSWRPGAAPRTQPDNFAWRAEPGTDLVLNVRLQPTGKPEILRPSMRIYFADKPPTRLPVVIELEHDSALDIPAGVSDFLLSDDFRLPMDVEVLAVFPQANNLAKVIQVYATLPDGTLKWLIRIPDWDANWQWAYRFKSPVFLPRGTVVSMRYHYDNGNANPHNPNQPPRERKVGPASTDEIGRLWLQVLPRNESDVRGELTESLMRHRLKRDPADFFAHLSLGELALARGDATAAVPLLKMAAQKQPNEPVALAVLGEALLATGNTLDAKRFFEKALQLNPHYVRARYQLAEMLASEGKRQLAAMQFRKVLAETPRDQAAEERLAAILQRSR